jgi:hypothetical protein
VTAERQFQSGEVQRKTNTAAWCNAERAPIERR